MWFVHSRVARKQTGGAIGAERQQRAAQRDIRGVFPEIGAQTRSRDGGGQVAHKHREGSRLRTKTRSTRIGGLPHLRWISAEARGMKAGSPVQHQPIHGQDRHQNRQHAQNPRRHWLGGWEELVAVRTVTQAISVIVLEGYLSTVRASASHGRSPIPILSRGPPHHHCLGIKPPACVHSTSGGKRYPDDSDRVWQKARLQDIGVWVIGGLRLLPEHRLLADVDADANVEHQLYPNSLGWAEAVYRRTKRRVPIQP